MQVRNVLMSTLFSVAASAALFAAPAEARRWDNCRNCGVITDISREGRDHHLGGGTVIGAIAGAALGNQVGNGDGRKAATVAGALAGGAVGHRVEKNRRDSRWRIDIQMDSGYERSVSMSSNRDGLRRGDRVQVRDGRVYLLR